SVEFEFFLRRSVDYVMYSTRRHDNCRSVGNVIFISINHASACTLLDTKELVIFRMYLQANIFVGLETHQHQLAVFASVNHFSKISIVDTVLFNICVISCHTTSLLYSSIVYIDGKKAIEVSPQLG